MWPLLVRITTPTHIPCMYLYYIDPIGTRHIASLTLHGMFSGLWVGRATAAKPSFRPFGLSSTFSFTRSGRGLKWACGADDLQEPHTVPTNDSRTHTRPPRGVKCGLLVADTLGAGAGGLNDIGESRVAFVHLMYPPPGFNCTTPEDVYHGR